MTSVEPEGQAYEYGARQRAGDGVDADAPEAHADTEDTEDTEGDGEVGEIEVGEIEVGEIGATGALDGDGYYEDLGYHEDDEAGYADTDEAGYGHITDEVPVATLQTSKRQARRRSRRVTTVLLALLAVVVLVGIVGFFRVSSDINPGGKPGPVVTVYIPKGSSTADIGTILSRHKVIHGGSTVFEAYVKLSGAGPLLAGTYRLHQDLSYSAVVNTLQAGPSEAVFKLVVPEGFTVREMAAAVARLHVGITAAQFEQAAMDGQVSSAYEPAGTHNLEGLLFPATYPVRPGETADELVQYMASTFDQEADAIGLRAAAKKLGYTPYQVVEVASIIEREAKLAQDRGPIASVIYNRLARGIALGAQSTLLYGLGNPEGHVSIYTPNPYNTQVHNGLPPTPIASPGVPSLEAAMHPPHTSYLYWVEVNPDGKMGFASTTAGFSQLQAQCRAEKLGC
ncbi:MAG TPA: endolytic transglycosylase MltG [Acidimicrobiales bacterium]|nr:endolytic transglycosylase MltG [Acidimicrobiales bacterium]